MEEKIVNVNVAGTYVEILESYNTEAHLESLAHLLRNHRFNSSPARTWNQYRNRR